MSWARFSVELEDPTDRGAGIACARTLARVAYLQRCRMTAMHPDAPAAAMRVRAVDLDLELEASKVLIVPPVLLRGVASTITLAIRTRHEIRLHYMRDADGHPFSALTLIGPDLESALLDAVLLTERVGALAISADEALTRLDDGAPRSDLPLYADGFALVVAGLADGWPSAYFTLVAVIDASHARELVESPVTASNVVYRIGIATRDDAVFGALFADVGDVALTWDEPGEAAVVGRPRICGLELDLRAGRCTIEINALVDGGTGVTAAWLSRHAGVPVSLRE